MLPLFLLCTHTDDLLYAALFQCALFQPTRAGHPETCVCGLYLRMGEAAVGLRELSQDPDERVVSPEMKEAHNGNLAAVLFWCLLFLLAPEPRFRTDALGLAFSLVRACGLPSGAYKAQPAWPKQKAAEQLCASDVPGLDLFWWLAPLQP